MAQGKAGQGRPSTVLGSVAVAVGLLVVAGCSSSGSKNVHAGAAQAAAGGQSTVAAGTTSAGSVLTDASGRTLYMFDKDTAGAATPACTGGCAATWPALMATGAPTAGPGVSGTVAASSDNQVTWNGHRLYRFAGDSAAGDVKGNGIGGIWHVVPASAGPPAGGTPATTAPSGYSRY